jgi:predicted nucleotidyltransferase
MLQNYNKYKILKIFFDNPTDSLRLRELCRLSKISPPSTTNYLKKLQKDNLIRKYVKRDIPYYQAERDNDDFTFYKKISIQYELHKSGLINHIWDAVSPCAIILYGSASKGEDTEDSDIDIFLTGKIKIPDVKKYEKILKKSIHILSEKLDEVSEELRSNLINGIVLKGFIDDNKSDT